METTTIDPQEQGVLRAYEEHPMAAGDAVLLLDDEVCLELAGLGDQWTDGGSAPLLRILAGTGCRSVRLLVARPGAELLASDYQLWRELHAGLRDTGTELRTLWALPAA